MIPDILFDALNCGARAAVAEAWFKTLQTVDQPDEVDHVFMMTKFGTAALGRHWGSILAAHHIALRVTGVFCHQTPKAYFTHPTLGDCGPELADLLVVHEHSGLGERGRRQVTRRAVLVQAKIAHQGVPAFGKVDPVQDYLYSEWPPFRLRGRGPKGKRFIAGDRDIGAIKSHGRYGLIEKTLHAGSKPVILPYSLAFPWTFSGPQRSPTGSTVRTAGGEDTGAFIANMLYPGGYPRGRTARVPKYPLALTGPVRHNNHFDVTVEELLTVTGLKTVHFRHRTHLRGPRGYPVCFCVQQLEGPDHLLGRTGFGFAVSEEGPPGAEDVPVDLEDDDGISTILIETGSAD
ncbi:MAG TPA: hypothetical protein VK146_15480 [Tabrizicola sp.]|nr:hypothetical protein [Tabrizicola sp.]